MPEACKPQGHRELLLVDTGVDPRQAEVVDDQPELWVPLQRSLGHLQPSRKEAGHEALWDGDS